MGKSEIVPMPRQYSLYAACKEVFKIPVETVQEVAEELNEDGEEETGDWVPEGMELYCNQVAGHSSDGRSIGLIKHQGTVLKPITNKKCGERELEFYDQLVNPSSSDLVELKDFVPKFYGKVSVDVRGRPIDCIVLEDLTKDFKEPCVMDVKIGKRTWDPEASYQKIFKEETKYQDCKRDLAFCIPGFQVYKLYNNTLSKFDKEYGKQLNKDSIRQALRTFLNGDTILCRSLIVQFLACLWKIQLWARKQRHLHLFSSSLLFVYDAKRLRDYTKTDVTPKLKLTRSKSLYRPLSLMILDNNEKIQTGFSGQLTKEGPILKTPRSPSKIKELGVINSINSNNNVWQKSIRALKRTHSFQNNYDKDMQNRRQDYNLILDELCSEQKSEMWAQVKMIDFAHAFPAEHHEIDRNYLEGIDNLIRIFEEFLVDSEGDI